MKLRWRIAYLLDRLPGQCWADLCSWAMHDKRDDPDGGRNPWSPIQEGCRNDLARLGSCYCGKLRGEHADEAWEAMQ